MTPENTPSTALSTPVKLPDLPPDYDPLLHSRLLALRTDPAWSDRSIARRAGLTPAALSSYGSGTYAAGVANLQARLRSALDLVDLEKVGGVPTIETPVFAQFTEFCNYALWANVIVLVSGDAGVGKSRGALYYATENPTSILVSVTELTRSPSALLQVLFKAAGIRASARRARGGTVREMTEELHARLKDSGRLLIFDDAHRLSLSAIWLICDLWNTCHLPIVLLGTDEVRERWQLRGQWISRVRMAGDLRVDSGDVKKLLEHQTSLILGCPAADARRLAQKLAPLAVGEGHFRTSESVLLLVRRLALASPDKNPSPDDLLPLALRCLPR